MEDMKRLDRIMRKLMSEVIQDAKDDSGVSTASAPKHWKENDEMVGTFARSGYLERSGSTYKYTKAGGREITVSIKDGQLKINGADCIENGPYQCRIPTGEQAVYIYSKKADELYYILHNDAFPSGYEVFRVYPRKK